MSNQPQPTDQTPQVGEVREHPNYGRVTLKGFTKTRAWYVGGIYNGHRETTIKRWLSWHLVQPQEGDAK